MAKKVDKLGVFKDYLKGIIVGGVGLVIAIVFFSVWGSQVLGIIFGIIGILIFISGLGLLIHAKRNNSYYVSKNGSSSSGGSSSYSSDDWDSKFKSAIENGWTGANYTSVYTTWENGTLIVNAEVDCGSWTGAGVDADEREAQRRFGTAKDQIMKYYNRVAKQCPHSSKLYVRRK